jgi:ATP-dependent protease ClpP protease subunit
MNNIKDDLALFHNSNIFFPTRTLYLSGEITDELFDQFIKNIHALDCTSGPISIKLMSPGGSVSTARAIYDAISGTKNISRIICYGEVASAATIILQAPDVRIMTPSSKLLIHIGEEGFGMSHPRNIDNAVAACRADQKWFEDIYLENIKLVQPRFTRKQLQKLLVFDTYLTAKEAIELGLADEIGDPQ